MGMAVCSLGCGVNEGRKLERPPSGEVEGRTRVGTGVR